MKWAWYSTYNETKPTISFLHGFLEDSSTWLPFLSNINESYNCLLIDLPSQDSFNFSPDNISFESIAQHFIFILKSLNIEKSHLVCHSMGGYFGCFIKSKYSDYIDKIVLCNSSFYNDKLEQKNRRNKIIRILNTNFSTFCKICFIKFKDGSEQMDNLMNSKIEKALLQDPKFLIAYQKLIKQRPNFESVFHQFPNDFFFTFGEFDTDILWKETLSVIKKRYYIFPNEKHILPLNSIVKWSDLVTDHLK